MAAGIEFILLLLALNPVLIIQLLLLFPVLPSLQCQDLLQNYLRLQQLFLDVLVKEFFNEEIVHLEGNFTIASTVMVHRSPVLRFLFTFLICAHADTQLLVHGLLQLV